jgi:hypothetical protein
VANRSERLYQLLHMHRKQPSSSSEDVEDHSALRTPTSSRWRKRSAGSL